MIKQFLGLVAILVSILAHAQPKAAGARQDKPFVREYSKNKTIKRYALKNEPVFQRINNILNISLTTADGGMLQINGIPESLLKDTTLRTAAINVVYITPSLDTTYVSNTKRTRIGLTIRAKSLNVGSPISVLVTARVYHQKDSKLFEILATGFLPEKEYRETN